MYLKSLFVIIVIFGSKCEENTNSATQSTTVIQKSTSVFTPTTVKSIEQTTTATKPVLSWGTPMYGTPGLYGGSYYTHIENPNNTHYIHGLYQSPTRSYYVQQNYYFLEENGDALDYYLGYGLSKMTDKNFQYDDFHHYFHDLNRTIIENETIRSDFIISCHPNATYLCPENTETVCLLNGTIYCMSKISIVENCEFNSSILCVNTTVPCVKQCDLSKNYFEEISMPCLASITVLDVYEDKGKTISKVGGTFILIDALKEKDKILCVTVIVDPSDPEEIP